MAVEKLDIHKNGTILGDGKRSVASYKSLISGPRIRGEIDPYRVVTQVVTDG